MHYSSFLCWFIFPLTVFGLFRGMTQKQGMREM